MQQTPNTIWTSGNRALDLRRSLRRLEVAAIALLGAVIVWGASQSIQPAAGQGVRIPCSDEGQMAEYLAKKYSEVPVAIGLQANGSLLQVYASDEKGTWTIVNTTPGGRSCIVAVGERWESLPVAVAGSVI